MNLNNIGVLALLGSVPAFWGQLKSFILKIFSFIIRTDLVKDENLSRKA